ncbi:MAG: TRAP transporter substrate-binding protein [Paracoccaceae bacterium]
MTATRRTLLTGAGAALAAAPLATPAISQNRREMIIVSTWPRDFPGVGLSAQRLASRIPELTGGRIQTQYFAAGERVGAFDVFDEVASGNAQAYIGAEYYWKGKHPAFAYFTAVPFGLTANEWNAWNNFGGGQALWDELAAEFGLKGIPCGNTGLQMGGWFNKEIESAEDLRGLKMRIPGLGGDVLAKLGASPVSLPGGQIYENLVSGSIDATEWIGPYNDYFMKLYEAAQYYYWPGMHEPGPALALGMNKSWWDGLTADEQALITAASLEENGKQLEEATWNNGRYLQRMIDENGVELREFNDDVYSAFGEAAAEVFEETREHSELAQRVHDSFAEAREQLGRWTALSDMAYVQKRNRVLDL